MAGKTYFGNASSLPVFPKNIYIGNNSNQPTVVKEIYIGNSSNQPVRVWPNMVIPDANYQQVEYIGANQNTSGEPYIDTGVKLKVSNPRIVTKFSIQSSYRATNYLVSIFDARNIALRNVYEGFNVGFYQDHAGTDAFAVVFGNASGEDMYSSQTDGQFMVNPSSIKSTSSSMEGILTNVPYIIDFDNRSNGYSRFYLYAAEGYYSLPAHNLLWNVKTPTFNASPWNEEYAYRMCLNPTFRTRFYSFKMYNTSGSLIRNYYPCYKKSDNNMLGFYDIVNRVFYSAGSTTDSGSLDYGPDYIGEL